MVFDRIKASQINDSKKLLELIDESEELKKILVTTCLLAASAEVDTVEPIQFTSCEFCFPPLYEVLFGKLKTPPHVEYQWRAKRCGAGEMAESRSQRSEIRKAEVGNQ